MSSAKLRDDSSDGDDDMDSKTFEIHCAWPNMPLEPDTFGLTICCMVRDFTYLAQHKGSWINRYSRVCTTLTLLILCITIQVFLLKEVKHFVSARAVHDVRTAYDAFEHHMYGGATYVISETPILERRGIGGPSGAHFDPEAFEEFDSETKASVCCIPMSQPLFFFAVLYVWTLTCVADLRKCKDLFESLILQTERCADMSRSLVDDDDDGVERFVIARLTMPMKCALTLMVLIPRLLITCYLLWVGCRWLLGTTDFSELILNSVALEFILNLKDMLYLALVPRRSMIDLENTEILPSQPREPESLMVLVGTMFWAILAAVWVGIYMGVPGVSGLQSVLRHYQWDVHDVCTSWIASRFTV
eukprot:CAMPEP_0176081662 /NCGR_PEP_ID=MMETSP0120_2-20121206/40848_1 /TAXON_ID=160619 /ORGANISM="Kryptoperidinium foliaceum, Strain CCMP 1326" /LENGTH=359 /DNA_ID=CAMNT_0017415429 /DNA_START=100 /DNA_END=1179 /DNA_ORIENTATION=-